MQWLEGSEGKRGGLVESPGEWMELYGDCVFDRFKTPTTEWYIMYVSENPITYRVPGTDVKAEFERQLEAARMQLGEAEKRLTGLGEGPYTSDSVHQHKRKVEHLVAQLKYLDVGVTYVFTECQLHDLCSKVAR